VALHPVVHAGPMGVPTGKVAGAALAAGTPTAVLQISVSRSAWKPGRPLLAVVPHPLTLHRSFRHFRGRCSSMASASCIAIPPRVRPFTVLCTYSYCITSIIRTTTCNVLLWTSLYIKAIAFLPPPPPSTTTSSTTASAATAAAGRSPPSHTHPFTPISRRRLHGTRLRINRRPAPRHHRRLSSSPGHRRRRSPFAVPPLSLAGRAAEEAEAEEEGAGDVERAHAVDARHFPLLCLLIF